MYLDIRYNRTFITLILIQLTSVWRVSLAALMLHTSRVVRKPAFCICENKDADQLRGNSFAVTAKLISAFVFATRIVQTLFFLNPKFQASSHLLWLYSPVCVGPGRKPQTPDFSQRGPYVVIFVCSSKLFDTRVKILQVPLYMNNTKTCSRVRRYAYRVGYEDMHIGFQTVSTFKRRYARLSKSTELVHRGNENRFSLISIALFW